MSARVLVGDCREVMAGMDAASVDAVVTDPPYELAFMGKGWDNAGVSFDPETWVACLRVLKPGGHLLAFGGSRTFHRIAVAIEDAGFEIRDTLSWLYGSGFPKSLDVGKALDKVNGETDRLHRFTAWMRTTGLTAKRINDATGTFMGSHYLTAGSQPAIPTPDLWDILRPMCGDVPDWVDRLVERIAAEREVVGPTRRGAQQESTGRYGAWGDGVTPTAPATDLARQWDGWGTAIKPSTEPVVVAQKPYSMPGDRAIIDGMLSRLEADLCALLARSAEPSSRPTRPIDDAAKDDSVLTPAATDTEGGPEPTTQTGPADGTHSEADTSASTSAAASIALNTISSWRRVLADACDVASTSTTETASSLTTDLRTWSLLLSRITLDTMLRAASNPNGASRVVWLAERLSIDVAAKSNAIRVLSAPASVTASALPTCPAGAGDLKPNLEFVILARKPLSGTVAANVAAHGTGALNIDGCRIGTEPVEGGRHGRSAEPSGSIALEGGALCATERTVALGRWPANVVLGCCGTDPHDPDCAAALLDAAVGELKPRGNRGSSLGVFEGYHGGGKTLRDCGAAKNHGDSGGPSRFFYCAKASRAERNAGLDSPSTHPTVKPLSLMAWLVTLVTPPGGTVLDPFLGSGSTGCAAAALGFDFIGIEQDPDYALIAERRIAYWVGRGLPRRGSSRPDETPDRPSCDTTDKGQLGLPIGSPRPDPAIA